MFDFVAVRVVRLAVLLDSSSNAADPEPTFDQYAHTYPTGGSFEYAFTNADEEYSIDGDAAEVLTTTLTFTTVAAVDDGGDSNQPTASDLLMMSLPHHQRSFVDPHYERAVTIDTVVGDMVGVIGSQWRLAIPAVPSSYQNFRTPREVDSARVDAIKKQLLEDMTSSATAGEPDPYGFGKSLSKLGRMALISEELKADEQLRSDLLTKMKEFVKPWLESTNPDKLLYDKLYGGIVSTNGVKDPAQDFGQGYYNDHHFHYVSLTAQHCAIQQTDELGSLILTMLFFLLYSSGLHRIWLCCDRSLRSGLGCDLPRADRLLGSRLWQSQLR